jgi:hypothetical protein
MLDTPYHIVVKAVVSRRDGNSTQSLFLWLVAASIYTVSALMVMCVNQILSLAIFGITSVCLHMRIYTKLISIVTPQSSAPRHLSVSHYLH